MPIKKLAALTIAIMLFISASQPTFAASRLDRPIQKNARSSSSIPRYPHMPIAPIRAPVPPSGKSIPVLYGNLQDWYGYVNSRFLKCTKYRVIDFDTKLSYTVIRVGGSCHADVEPATVSDTQTMYQTLGNTWNNWRRRALIVIINNEPIAASLYGEPHAYETIPNNGLRGQVCIHFLNSRTHGTNRVDPDHQYQIKRAAGLIQ